MFWLFLTLLAVVAGLVLRKRNSIPADREPWEADSSDDEPLDMDEIRRAESEWELEEAWEEPPEEEWR